MTRTIYSALLSTFFITSSICALTVTAPGNVQITLDHITQEDANDMFGITQLAKINEKISLENISFSLDLRGGKAYIAPKQRNAIAKMQKRFRNELSEYVTARMSIKNNSNRSITLDRNKYFENKVHALSSKNALTLLHKVSAEMDNAQALRKRRFENGIFLSILSPLLILPLIFPTILLAILASKNFASHRRLRKLTKKLAALLDKRYKVKVGALCTVSDTSKNDGTIETLNVSQSSVTLKPGASFTDVILIKKSSLEATPLRPAPTSIQLAYTPEKTVVSQA